jgi:hypothetical protein
MTVAFNDDLTTVDCLLCAGKNTVMVEEHRPGIENNSIYYLCTRCGYTTTSDMVIGSDFVERANKTSPRLVKDLILADNTRNLVWYPAIINIYPKGICYPDGVVEDWKWVVAPYKKLTDEEKKMYTVDNDETKFTFRLSIENSVRFDRLDFQNVLSFLGALVERTKS